MRIGDQNPRHRKSDGHPHEQGWQNIRREEQDKPKPSATKEIVDSLRHNSSYWDKLKIRKQTGFALRIGISYRFPRPIDKLIFGDDRRECKSGFGQPDGPVPEGRQTIAQRFNAGSGAAPESSPGRDGRSPVGGKASGSVVPDGTRFVGRATPPMNRWAILFRPAGLGNLPVKIGFTLPCGPRLGQNRFAVRPACFGTAKQKPWVHLWLAKGVKRPSRQARRIKVTRRFPSRSKRRLPDAPGTEPVRGKARCSDSSPGFRRIPMSKPAAS